MTTATFIKLHRSDSWPATPWSEDDRIYMAALLSHNATLDYMMRRTNADYHPDSFRSDTDIDAWVRASISPDATPATRVVLLVRAINDHLDTTP